MQVRGLDASFPAGNMTTHTARAPADVSQSPGAQQAPQAHAARAHKGRRQSRNKKGSDPFLEISDEAVKLPELSTSQTRENDDAGQSQSLLADVGSKSLDYLGFRLANLLSLQLVLTPINMVTFILSLSVVDLHQRQWRLSQRPAAGQQTLWSKMTPWSWLDPEPYQDSRDTTWKGDNSAAAQNRADNSFGGWYTRKKHRAMAKMELHDAFEMRGRVLVAIIVWMLLGLVGLAYTMRRTYAYVSV